MERARRREWIGCVDVGAIWCGDEGVEGRCGRRGWMGREAYFKKNGFSIFFEFFEYLVHLEHSSNDIGTMTSHSVTYTQIALSQKYA
jgi:hypothetical protein